MSVSVSVSVSVSLLAHLFTMLPPTVTASLYPRLNSCARNHYRIPVYPYYMYDLLSSLYSFQPDPSTSMHVACATARSVSSREDDDDVELRMRGRGCSRSCTGRVPAEESGSAVEAASVAAGADSLGRLDAVRDACKRSHAANAPIVRTVTVISPPQLKRAHCRLR